MQSGSSVEFYFDPISPYSWLAARQRSRFDAAGVALDFRPVLFAGLLAAHGNKGPAELPAKRVYTMRDTLRQAARLGVPAKGPPTHPFNPLRGLRLCIALDNAVERQRFGIALMDAAWEHGLDLTDDAVLGRIARECGLDGAALLARAGEADVKRRLVAATDAAIAAGVFGVPTFRVDGELFWGADRIDAVLWRLQGHTIDESLLADVLARPASASRKPA
ncbi:MAG TPA: 2-hydroxychromene-2-carboxylate isomerase [Burkholderiaceae bacterium]|nr:2-hydroxychromene-2-carboxylate isomerase [Burkholderiaceae bacterium]HQR71892.1 2-hydroxychromene-2-carboxylate isomerase [Burkholderiaceae bacterium]